MEIKKVEISMKNPETYQITRFSCIKSQNHNLLKKEQYEPMSILVFLFHAEHLFSIKTVLNFFFFIVDYLYLILIFKNVENAPTMLTKSSEFI